MSMFRFFRESFREFDHVVFPTRTETRTYFSIVLSVLVAMTIYLFIIGSLLGTGLSETRELVNPDAAASLSESDTGVSGLDGIDFEDLDIETSTDMDAIPVDDAEISEDSDSAIESPETPTESL